MKYQCPDAALDMPELVGMRVIKVNKVDTKRYSLDDLMKMLKNANR